MIRKHSLIIAAAGFAAVACLSSSFAAEVAPRTPSYTVVTQQNIAAEFTVNTYLERPHLIGDEQFVAAYAKPDTNLIGSAAASFKCMGANVVTAVDNDLSLLKIRIGFGVKDVFGAGILYNLNKDWTKNTPPAPAGVTETYTSHIGEGIGAFGSFNLMEMCDLFGNFVIKTGPLVDYVEVTPPAPAVKTKAGISTIAINVGAIHDSKAEGEPAFGANVFWGIQSAKAEAATVTVDNSGTAFGVIGSFGIPVKKTTDYAVFLGAKLGLADTSTDDKIAAGAAVKTSNILNIFLMPNLAFQKELGNGFEVTCGASATLLSWTAAGDKPVDAALGTEHSTTNLSSPSGTFGIGLRWVKDNFAIDAELNQIIITRGPDFISGAGVAASNMFARAGLTLGF